MGPQWAPDFWSLPASEIRGCLPDGVTPRSVNTWLAFRAPRPPLLENSSLSDLASGRHCIYREGQQPLSSDPQLGGLRRPARQQAIRVQHRRLLEIFVAAQQLAQALPGGGGQLAPPMRKAFSERVFPRRRPLLERVDRTQDRDGQDAPQVLVPPSVRTSQVIGTRDDVISEGPMLQQVGQGHH